MPLARVTIAAEGSERTEHAPSSVRCGGEISQPGGRDRIGDQPWGQVASEPQDAASRARGALYQSLYTDAKRRQAIKFRVR
jgi:hypothetical protein